MIWQRLIWIEGSIYGNLFEDSDIKLEKAERKGWKLIDIRAYIVDPESGISRIYMLFERTRFYPNQVIKNDHRHNF